MLNTFKQLPPDPIFNLMYEFRDDPNPDKVNLGIGIYTDLEGGPVVFPSIQKAAQSLDISDFNYQPIGGNVNFLNHTARLVLGADVDLEGLALQSTCGGTQACRLFADLVVRETKRRILVGTPTWGNHYALFKSLEIVEFAHLNQAGEVNLEGYKNILETAQNNDILLLHGGPTHNPCGKNLNMQELGALVDLINDKEIMVFVDFAYLGFGNSIEQDRERLQFLYKNCDQLAFGVSFSKNACLYEHRTGVLGVKTNQKNIIESQLQNLIRECISTPPGFGQEIMNNIFDHNFNAWASDLDRARQDIDDRRQRLVKILPDKFSYLGETHGMFGLLQETPEFVQNLKEKHSVYMPSNGRINFGGIREGDFERLGRAFGWEGAVF